MHRRSVLALAFAPLLGCSTFLSTPALPGERSEPVPEAADAAPEVAPEPEPAPEPIAVETQPEPSRKRKKKRAPDHSRGWSVHGNYTTVAPQGFLVEHLGVPHDKEFSPIGGKSIFPGTPRETDRSSSDLLVVGRGKSWGIAGEASFMFIAQAHGSYSSDKQSVYAVSLIQTHCASEPQRGRIKKSARIDESAVFVPYEVCYGYAIVYEFTSESTKLDAGIGGSIKGFSGSIEGFRKTHGVDIELSTVGFKTSELKCDASQFVNPNELLGCLKANKHSDTPITVRWRRLEYDEWDGATMADVKSKKCRQYRISEYRYVPAKGTPAAGSVVLKSDLGKWPGSGSSDKGRLDVRAGGTVSYTVWPKTPAGSKNPTALERNSFSVPKGYEGGVLKVGHLSVRAECVR